MSAYEKTDGYWIGSLSMALACVLKHKDPTLAREPLEQFLKAPVASDELKRMLRAEVKR